MSSSTRNCNGSNSNSSSSRSSSSNHMPAQRGNASRRISESSSSLGTSTATTTSTSSSSSSSSVKHVVADKSAVKRKKRRKDEDDGEDEAAAIITERVPVVLLTRLEDEKKANESRANIHVSDVKVVIERTKSIESIRPASSDGSVLSVGKKYARHSVHRSSENIASNNAKTLDTTSEKEERLKSPSRKGDDKKVVEEKLKVPAKKEENKKVVEVRIEAPSKKEEEQVKAPTKKEKVKALSKKKEVTVEANKVEDKTVVEERIIAPSKKKEKKVVEEKVEAPSKKENKVVEEKEAPSKKQKKVVKEKVEAPSKKQKKVVEERIKSPSRKDEEKAKAPAKKEDKKLVEEKEKVPSKEEEENVKAPAKKAEKKVVEEKVKALLKKTEEKKVVEEKTKAPSKKEKEKKVVEEKVKAPPKKSIESTKNSDQTESKSSKVKNDQKEPLDDLAERNVHNVNNDNLKRIDPKISERQLSVRLDRSQVESYLEKQRLQRLQLTEDKSIAETDKYHSGSETQEDNVLSKEIKTCAIPSDDAAVAEKVQNDSLEKVQNDSLEKVQNDSLEKVQNDSLEKVQNDSLEKVQNDSLEKVQNDFLEKASVDEKEVTNKVEEAAQENAEKPAEIKVKKSRGRPRKNKEETAESVVKNQRLPSKEKKKRAAKSKDVAADESNKQDSDKDLGGDTKTCEDSSVQVSENQIERLDESPKDTSCEFAKSDEVISCPSSESLNESAVVVHSEQESSKVFETDKLNEKIVESNLSSDNAIANDDSSSVPEAEEPAQLPMEVDAIPQDCSGADDSKAEDDSAQQICDIHSKSAEEVAKTVAESTEATLSESTEGTLLENKEAALLESTEATFLEGTEATLLESTELLVENSEDSVSSESPIENLISSDSTVECPAKTTTEKSETSELLSENLLASETSESVVNEISKSVANEPSESVANETLIVNSEVVVSPTDSFVSCENAEESTHEGSISGENNDSLIETIEEDTESTASTCTLIEEAPEELSQDIDKDLDDPQDELPEDVETLPDNVERLPENVENLPEVVERISEAVESQPEHVERISEAVDSQPEHVERISEAVESPPEVDDDEVHKEIKSIKELPHDAEKEDESESPEDVSLKPDDESFSQEDKTVECPELQESTFENNLKSVENLVIDSILNGEIVSPKITLQSAASRVEDQSFVFESGVEDFVNDIVAKDTSASLEPTTPVDEIPTSMENNFVPSAAMVEAEVSQVVAETLQSAVPIEEPPSCEATLPLASLPSVVDALAIEEASKSLAVVEQTSESVSPVVTEEEAATTSKDTSELATPNEEPIDEEFAKHRRKYTLLELKKKCTENIDKRNAQASLEHHENDQQLLLPQANSVDEMTHLDDSDLQVPSSVLSSDLYHPESTGIGGNENYFENISDAESEICLAERLSRLTGLDIPSLDEEPLSSLADKSEGEESTPDRTKRQRILMKITKTEANKHVTHLVDEEKEAEDLSMLESSEQQLIAAAAEQVTEGEIKIIMRKESSSNNHVIKEIKIIPRTPEGNNSARIPGYSPTSSDLSSGNSSCRVPSCSPAKPDSGSYRMPGWSPASTEIGQSTTIKKKQGRPKKYPIFTDAELIAKTTAIVNNGDVHTANKLTADKPLFQPVESIRINEDDEVEDHEEEEEHQTMMTEQTCLSGSQLLEAMPTQPEIMAKLAQQIVEGQELAKKKRKGGRPRKHPRPGDIIDEGTKPIVNENVTVARIEFNVVDSIEELVEPDKQMPTVMPVSPIKRARGRPRKVLTQESTVEESDSIVEDATAEKKVRTSRRLSQDGDNSSMTEDNAVVAPPKIERRGQKPWKHLKNLDKSAENQTIDGADLQIEDETVEDATVTKKVERRGRKPWKHLKNLESQSAESADSQTEDETTVSDETTVTEAIAKPKVERRGKKSSKHLKNLQNQSADGGDSQTENETVGNDAVSKPKVERRGRKPWKHLKNISNPPENQVAEDADSQTEDETMDDAAITEKVERRGRKPWKHLKNKDQQPSENQTTEVVDSQTEDETVADSQTEDETVDDAHSPSPRVERRGRKPWKHLKNIDKTLESQSADDADSQTEDETFDDASAPAPRVERRGRKPWKHLKNVDKTAESQVAEDADSQTEDETVDDASAPPPRVERRGRKPWKHLKNVDKTAESQVADDADSQTEDETVDDAFAPAPRVERRGRKPWKHLKNVDPSIEIQAIEDADSQTEDETVDDASAPAPRVERRGRKPSKHLKNVDKTAENDVTENVESQTEGETTVCDDSAPAPRVERRGRKPSKHLKNVDKTADNQTVEGIDSQAEDETVGDDAVTKPKIERRGRKPWKHLKNIEKAAENPITDGADSQTESETPPVDDTSAPEFENVNKPSESEVAETADSQTEDESVGSEAVTKKVERRGRKPWKHLKNIDQRASETPNDQTTEGVDSQTEVETADDASPPATRVERRGRKPWKHLKKENQIADGADSQTEDETFDDAVVTKKVERRGRKPWKHLKNVDKPSENQVPEDAGSKTVDETVDNTLETEENRRKLENSMTEGESADDTIEADKSTNAEEANSMTENESADDSLAPEPKVERRGRKPWKHLKNLDKSTDSQVTADSQTEDETVDDAVMVAKKVENAGRKPWKHLKNNSQSSGNLVSQEQDSMTEGTITNDDSVSELKVKKKLGRPLKYKKKKINILKMILPHEKRKRGRPRLEDSVGVIQLTENSVFKKTSALLENSLVSESKSKSEAAKDIPAVDSESKESSSDVTTPSEETTSNIENDTPAVKEVIKKKRGRKSLKNLQTSSIFVDNNLVAAAEMNSMTEDESTNDALATGDEATPVVEKKKKGRPRKIFQDDSIVPEEVSSVTEDNTVNDTIAAQNESIPVESAVVAEEVAKSPVTEDETVSSTEDIPTKNPSPTKSHVVEESSSLTEDETVSSTEDIPTSDPQQQQPVVKRGRPRKIVQTDSSTTPSASSVEESTTTMEPPVVVKRRARQPFKKPQQADSTLPDNNTSAYTTEDETVSSTEDIPTSGEQQQQQPVVKKDGRGKSRKNVPEVEMSDSLAASSVEDLSAVVGSPKKKRGRKPKVRLDDSETAVPTEGESSMAASSMEDLSLTAQPVILKKKRGRKPKVQLQDDSTCSESMEEIVQVPVHQKKRGRPLKYPRIPIHLIKSANMSADSIEEFSPVKQLSPIKLKKQQEDGVTPKVLEQVAATLYQDTFAKEQPTYDKSATSLSPVKKRGRPPKFPRKEIVTDESSAAEQQPAILDKRKGRLPRRLSQDENILPSHIDNRPGRSPCRMSHDEEDAPVLGKRQGRPPRKFSPDEEHSFSAVPQTENDSPTAVGKRSGRSPRKYSPDEGVPAVSDSDELSSGSAKRKGRRPKKFAIEDGFTSGGESTSPTKRKGRPPKSVVSEESPPIPQPPTVVESEKTPVKDVSLPIVPPLPVATSNEDTGTKKISTTNLLRQQRKPKMAQPQPPVAEPTSVSVSPAAPVVEKVQQPNIPPPLVPIKKGRGRPSTKLLNFVTKQQESELSGGLTLEQLRRRRHSQDDSMFTEELPTLLTQRSKEFEDAQSKKKRGRPPKMRELSKHFVLTPLKPKTVEEAIAQAVSPTKNLVLQERQYQKMGRPRKLSFEKSPGVQQPERPSRLSAAAEFLRTWTDRDESPTTQSSNNKKHVRRRRLSQDDSVLSENFALEESRPSSRNRLRRYSQGDTLDDSSNEGLLNSRKRLRSSGSDSSLSQDEKRPRVERELCDQHSITKELLVKLTKIDKNEEQAATASEPIRELLKMSLRRKIGSTSNVEPPPLVPIEPHRLQPATHSDAKLLMLMQPSEEKALMQQAVPQQQALVQPAQMQTQQFCIIFIPDSLTTNDPNLPKDAQPTATIVNFQPVPDAEMTNKSVTYTPTTPKIFVNNEEQQNRSLLCQTCTQALDMIQRMQANVGMTEEDKCAIRCQFCSENFQSTFHFEYHLRQEHFKCENERQCRNPGFNTLRILSQDAAHESAIYITYALKCRSCYELFENVQKLNDHVKQKHANLIRQKPPVAQFSTPTGMVCYPPPPPFKNGARAEVLHCPSDCICRIGIRSTDSPQQRANVLKRCPNFMRRMEKIEAAAYEVYTCAVCKSTFLMRDEVVEHLMKMHEVACKFPCTKCLASFRTVQLQENHQCSETTIRDLDKLINIVIMPTDKSHDNSKFEDSSNDELGPIKTTPPPAVPSASTPLNGLKRRNGVVIQKLSRYLTVHPPKKAKLDTTSTPLTGKKRQKTPCPKCQKKFAYRKSLNDHIIFEHIIPCRADEASKNMAVELLRLVNNGSNDILKIRELADALGKHTDDDGVSLRKLTMIDDEQENWNDQLDNDRDLLQCANCKSCFKLPAANLSRRNNQHPIEAPGPALCECCDPTRRRRNVVNNGHSFNNLKSAISNGEPESPQRVQYLFECDHCGDTFPTTIELNRHKTEEHTQPGDGLKCDICAKILYSPRMLEKHKKMHHDDSMSNSRLEDDENLECNNQSMCNVSKDGSEANDTMNSSTSRRDSTDNVAKEEEKCKCPHCEYVAEKVSLKNHLKREHGVMAFICQFCGKLLVDISEVRHMLDYHIKSSNRKNNGSNGNGTNVITATSGAARDEDDVFDLLKTLGKKRLQSLMIYHDFEGKCNNAIMRCPICPEQFATRESCRHHYQWMHDSTCILCDTTYEGGNVAGKHKVAVHNSIASYVWAIQRLVSAIVHGLRLDRAQPSNVLYTEVSMRVDSMINEETNIMMMNVEGELPVSRTSNNKSGNEETVPEPFLEPVVLSEDQLPGSGNMIEVVIGNDVMVEDSEDNLLENFYLSPNYESSCEQPKILDAGAPIPELEEEEDVVAAVTQVPMATACATLAIPTTPSITTSNGGILIPTTPVTADTYATSAVFKLRQDNGQEEVVLAITDEDLVTYRDDIGSLAERLSATCDSLSLEEITTMLRSYFENVGIPQEVDLANATVEPRTQ